MSGPYRLPSLGCADRRRRIHFIFNGRVLEGYAGDTIASALLANGISLVGRSFKYHRPRGVLTHGSAEPNALLLVDRGRGRIEPNNRATTTELTENLVVQSQNHWPSLAIDVGAVNDFLSPLLAAGFYYKTFMWPRSFWGSVYEPAIRAAAGLGISPKEADPDRYVHKYAHCDVLVVGGGPAGLAAALAASEGGAAVLLVDEQPELGGSLLHDVSSRIDDASSEVWRKEVLEHLASRANVQLLSRTTAFGYYNQNYVGLVERVTDHLEDPDPRIPRERLWQVRAKEVVLCTGAHERPLAFPNNDRPGIMLAESIRVFINRYGVAPGKKIIFVTNGAAAYQAAIDAKCAGVDVSIIDERSKALCGAEFAMAADLGIEVLNGFTSIGSRGRKRVTGLVVSPVGKDEQTKPPLVLECDCVGMSGGWTPAVHLFSQSRGRLDFKADIDAFIPGRSAQSERSAGAAKGTYDLAKCLQEGWDAGLLAANGSLKRSFTATPTFAGPPLVRPASEDNGAKAFIDFQNDVTANDIRLAIREGFESVEHVKRYTTTGMATDQGKSSNMLALGVIAGATSKPTPQVGTTTFRPPYTPVTFGALIGMSRGELFDPLRKTPIDEWAEARGAVFENVSLWRRARYFPREGESMQDAVARECRAVRSAVGAFDASTLGKIEVVGPDAAEFLNRIYINSWLKLGVGKCRYGVMLRENGFILDDGVVARLATDRFHVTTTSGGAPHVFAHMEEFLQTEWPELRVFLTSTTEQWAVIALQGPKAREVLLPLVSDIDLSAEAFPHMSVRTGLVCGVPARVFRVSFTGELGFEINVPARFGRPIWEKIFETGKPYGIAPYGTEAMHVLRAERGFIIVGQETDGTVTPDDVGLSGMVAQSKPDFVGKRSLSLDGLVAKDRKQLVGLLTVAPGLILEEGAQLIADPSAVTPCQSKGHVTSSYWSDTCGRSIALGLIVAGREQIGKVLFATTPEGFAPVRIVESAFVDPAGDRVNA